VFEIINEMQKDRKRLNEALLIAVKLLAKSTSGNKLTLEDLSMLDRIEETMKKSIELSENLQGFAEQWMEYWNAHRK
jgi:RNA processing factor Prp31